MNSNLRSKRLNLYDSEGKLNFNVGCINLSGSGQSVLN